MYSSDYLPPRGHPNYVWEKYLLGVGAFRLGFAKGEGDPLCSVNIV